MAGLVTGLGNQLVIGNLQNDYAKLPRSSGDGMESQSFSNHDKNIGAGDNIKITETFNESTSVKQHNLSLSSCKEHNAAIFGGSPSEVDNGACDKKLRPLALQKENRNSPLKRSIETSTQSVFVASDPDTCLGYGNEVICTNSLSVERKAECLDLQSLVKDLETKNQGLSEENNQLLKKLSVLSKVNADLKKLLVASVGEDIGMRLEEMTSDKAQFDTTLKNLEKDLEETSEELNKVSIECDVWRSKFLASRMMTNGLTDIKTTLFLKSRNCQAALEKLLEEQSDIRQHLRATNRLLQGIHKRTNSAAHQSTKTKAWQEFQKSSIVELSHINFSLAEDICHTVNPGHFYASVDTISSADEEIIPVSDLTPAEQMACQVLKNETDEANGMGLAMSKMGRQYIGNSYASRFLTNNFRITFDCCERCTGALKVV
ncbi:golgin-45-like [Dendronephthya gigantea]|uniref:golgin-45-like n=1 Tax=Dendronephthya gigantea TaxID=151771 RepID=UPI00106A8116|nr:golgin-45-like [Dendronephthya gigantea]